MRRTRRARVRPLVGRAEGTVLPDEPITELDDVAILVAHTKKSRGVEPPGDPDGTSDWREPPGSAANTREVHAACVRTPLVAALEHRYLTDAHCFLYVVP